MTKVFHLPLGSRPYLRAVMLTSDHQFPQSKAGACLTLKTSGVDALFGGSFPTVMIFSDGRRFVVRGGRPAELAIRSVNSVKNGGFRITESLGKHGSWLPWFKNRQFHLKVVDPMLIEIAEGPVSTRFFKCSSDRTSL
jgi:hypothetical protein